MIAKILKPASTFSGVRYNENKNEKGQSELLSAKNFSLVRDNLKIADYTNYMELICSTNNRVKNKQFHAVISCKGREFTPDQLKEIAEKYIDKMGYSKNPYLIYFHSDTANNHVHIVSTRIDKLGEKVKDSNERIRSLKAINEIMGVDLKKKAGEDLKNALDYSFANIKQFKLILESNGTWSVGEKDKILSLYKGKEVHGKIDIEEVNKKASEYQPDDKRKKQIVAIIHKYKQGLSHKELKDLMKSKFGIDLIFHTGRGHITPYGYTVLDHKSRSIFKGSDIMDLKTLLKTPTSIGKMEACNGVVNLLMKENSCHTILSFKADLSKMGYSFSNKGEIGIKGGNKSLLTIDPKVLKELRYNSRLVQADKFNAKSKAEANLLSRLFFVKAKDITLNSNDPKSSNFISYRDMMNSYINNKLDVRDLLLMQNISFVRDKNEVFLIDSKLHNIMSASDLGIDLGVSKETERVQIIDTANLTNLDNQFDNNPDLASGSNMIESLFDILNQDMSASQDSRKRKRKKGQNPNQ